MSPKPGIMFFLIINLTSYSSSQTFAQSQVLPPKKEVPVLCFHHVSADSVRGDQLHIPGKRFREQMQLLKDSGYTTISPEGLLGYYKSSIEIPEKSIVISFDDGNSDQWNYAVPILNELNFKAVFFIMTVTIGKKAYLNEVQICMLADYGHYIGAHTWDHQNITHLKMKDHHWQLEKPKLTLEKITGKPVTAFAYPYGRWNEKVIPGLKRYGYTSAFQLTEASSRKYPFFTLRRMMVPGNWSAKLLMQKIEEIFGTTEADLLSH
ncbi:MAG: polysaccharide deacetylase family protein [Sphingobacteriales bacterium]|nr:MAG: polysaccharide deacetylase family protein [Sphingobacteriales bacterium]